MTILFDGEHEHLRALVEPTDPIPGLRVVTSSFKQYRPDMGLAVRTSVGNPWRFGPPSYPTANCAPLAPYGVFNNPELREAEAAVQAAAYWDRLRAIATKIDTRLRELVAEHPGKPLVLLCFEDVHAGQVCHRRWAADWLRARYGVDVAEAPAQQAASSGAKRSGAPTRRRRGPGEGSVYRRTSDGKWVASVGIPGSGRRRRKYVYGATRNEVLAKQRKVLAELERGAPLPDERRTVGDFFDWWVAEVLPHQVRASTLDSYEQKIRIHIKPALGSARLARLTPAQVQRLKANKLDEGQSPRSVQYILAVLRAGLAEALRLSLVARNVATLVRSPALDRREVEPWDPAEARAFLEAARTDRLSALFVTAVTVGLRQGELLGLHWAEVDLDRASVRVRSALRRQRGGGVEFVEPKSRRSRRTVPLPAVTVDALRAHRRSQLQERMAAGPDWAEQDLVFATERGDPLDVDRLRRTFHRIAAQAGLRRVRFHDLRHGAATFLLAAGVPMRVVMETLGHSSYQLTADTYSHVLPDLQRDAATAMDRVITEGR